ncbi:transporter substrate-binding domain-containing protein [Pseudomonas sp. LY-1]|jgi:ABC-type amino acid transport substrate-binding protein|uniref:Transporter substrate-binding domain-containing protein n=1 Tax=Pseudomonas veronii TaxID=76761 RepID=A0A7Y1F9F4_PSEVE|nr:MULTISPECIES: transporter substrate-binding domain-containing protein [Pseudomonas]NMY10041.1 transporter substrate-binding domain-containing protein [Pseudomonas veronii]PMU89651.1 amino acid ABC transporter substrate-binding protein [Pseudomonas sp. GW704-F3]PMU95811.1 amino acid ABC transporter substrate-binding protein [Pseudomonas sp. GW704-F5]PMV07455.1 amino acid ABC transporter substrate-binding protein [Pseudomonas sp. MPBD4-3]PMV32235.1 amino acid ABC transporter substrate-binding
MRKILLTGCTLGLLFGAPVQANEPPAEGTLSKIASTKSITLGYRDASVPFSYVGDQSGKPMGYSVDLANKIVERIQQKTGVANLSVKYNLVTSQTRIPLVQNGTVDLECGSTGVTAERQKQVAFSYGFIYVKGQLLTAKDSGIQGFADLKGKNVVTTAGTTNERFLKSYNAEHNGNLSVISAKDHGEAFKMLETGRAAAFYMDDALLYGERAKARDPHRWVVVGEEQSREIYSCMVRKDDPQFLAVVNDTLGDLYRTGEINGIYRRWFEQPIPPKGLNLEFPMTAELKAIFATPVSDPVE